MPMIMSGSPREPKNEQQAAGHNQSSHSIRGGYARLVRNGLLQQAVRGVLGVMRPRMRLSFLFDCDDVALPALKLDPDTAVAHVVPADVEVRQRAVLYDVECSCDDRF